MTCAHCGRAVVGVAVIFPGVAAVCGRADCLGWARVQLMAAQTVRAATPPFTPEHPQDAGVDRRLDAAA